MSAAAAASSIASSDSVLSKSVADKTLDLLSNWDETDVPEHKTKDGCAGVVKDDGHNGHGACKGHGAAAGGKSKRCGIRKAGESVEDMTRTIVKETLEAYGTAVQLTKGTLIATVLPKASDRLQQVLASMTIFGLAALLGAMAIYMMDPVMNLVMVFVPLHGVCLSLSTSGRATQQPRQLEEHETADFWLKVLLSVTLLHYVEAWIPLSQIISGYIVWRMLFFGWLISHRGAETLWSKVIERLWLMCLPPATLAKRNN